MKTTDGRELPEYGAASHVRQTPGPQKNWQDSVVLIWWDLERQVGGWHRIGHEVNAGEGGMIALWNTVYSPDGIYKRTTYEPLRKSDLLARGFGAGDTCRCEYVNGEHVWTIEDGDLRARIVHRDTGPNVDCYPKSATMADFATGHLDIPGRVTGVLAVAGREYPINGLSVRDHGWGPRDWGSVLTHRWVAGTAGAEFSFIALSWYAPDEAMASFGWVVRNGEITYAEKLDILTYVEVDGASNRGGQVRFELTTGEILEIECTPLTKPVASVHQVMCCIDVLCRFTCNDSIVGICDFESSSNPQQGSRRPRRLGGTIVGNGFFPA
ncbi:MAG TPA: hypothetical protein VJQ47_02270 [Steroidobacteraceae bacterium]|nr:hypothetical protein [Steroidobacteraceae bacterium]